MNKALESVLSEKKKEIREILAMENIDHRISRIAGLLHLPVPKEAKVLLDRIEGSASELIRYAEMSCNEAYHPSELQGIATKVINALAKWYSEEITPYVENRDREKSPYFVGY